MCLQPSAHPCQKGRKFTLSVVAVDQFNETVSNLSIYSFLSSYDGTLGEVQQLQNTGDGCTQLTFSVFSLQRSEELTMYPKGPCGDAEMSRLKQQVIFLPCDFPIGLSEIFRMKPGANANVTIDSNHTLLNVMI